MQSAQKGEGIFDMTDNGTPLPATEPILLANLTSPQMGDVLQQLEMVLIPVGAHEQHGSALPVSTDTLTASVLSSLAGTLLAPRVAVAPTIPWGVSWHHLGRPGTISLHEDTLIHIIRDHIDSLFRQGVKRFVLVNTHGGNNAALTVAAERAKRDLGVPLVVPIYAYSLLANSAREVIGEDALGHGGGDEASVILAIRPDLVDASKLIDVNQQAELLRARRIVNAAGGTLPLMMHKLSASGATGNASKASAEAGSDILGQAVNQLRAICEELLDLDLDLL